MRNRKHFSDRRGSVLLVAIILTLGLSIFLGSFVKLAMGAFDRSNRSFYSNSSLNLAEAGLEEALYSLNNGDWTGWVSSSGNKDRSISGVALGQGTTGTIKIRVYNFPAVLSPIIVAEGRSMLKSGLPIIKQIQVRASKKSFWANGLVAKDTVEFKGGVAYVDSFDSMDPNHSTGGLYDFGKRKDRGSVGSVQVTADALSISSAEIWGFAATGGSAPGVGPGGKIHGVATPVGVDVDPERIRTDFTANFESVSGPTTYDQIYTNVSGTINLGTAGSSTVIKATSIENSNGETTQILGDVTMVVTGDIGIKGDFVVDPHSSLTIYVEGDVDIGGNGLMNMTGMAKNLIMYGTGTSQTIKLHGNGAAQAAIYAPDADLELKGGGATGVFMGAAVAKTVLMTGNFEFHYDEDLSNVDSSGVYTVGGWRELNAQAERVSLVFAPPPPPPPPTLPPPPPPA